MYGLEHSLSLAGFIIIFGSQYSLNYDIMLEKGDDDGRFVVKEVKDISHVETWFLK